MAENGAAPSISTPFEASIRPPLVTATATGDASRWVHCLRDVRQRIGADFLDAAASEARIAAFPDLMGGLMTFQLPENADASAMQQRLGQLAAPMAELADAVAQMSPEVEPVVVRALANVFDEMLLYLPLSPEDVLCPCLKEK